MIKKISIIIVFLLLICGISTADNYIINDNTVYIDDSKVYLSANPHTLSSSGWVYFNLTSKVYTGNIDACWGFNTSVSKPTKAEIYSPRWINTTTNHQKIFYNPTHVVYTGDNLDYGNSYNTNYKYTVTETINNDNGTTYITSNVAFDSYTINGTNYTIYWHNRHDNHCLWEDFSPSFNSVIHNYNGYNKWYYIKNIPITSNKEYTVRTWIDVPVSTQKQSGKYYFAIKPSHETISQAVANGHFYNLDPWWDATWTHRKEIILTGGTSGAQTNYQVLLNVSFDSDMQSDFDDLRFCNETHELDSWLESKVDDSYALVWVEFPTTPANGVNQTYYMYYGNAGAASDWDIRATMLDGDDFTGAALDTNIWGKQYCDAAVSNGILTLDTFVSTGGRYACGILGKRLVGPSAVTEVRINSVTSPQCGGTYGLGTHHLYSSGDETGVWHTGVNGEVGGNVDNGAASFTTDQSFSYNTYYRYKIVHTGSTVHYYRDGVEKTGSPLATNKPDATMYMKIGGDASHSPTLKLDWIFARKYAANPPTYAFGSEEYYTPPTPTTIVNETKLIMSEITTGLKSINMGNYLVYAFILIGILLIILGIQIITNNMYRG